MARTRERKQKQRQQQQGRGSLLFAAQTRLGAVKALWSVGGGGGGGGGDDGDDGDRVARRGSQPWVETETDEI